jgi:hypothetical protein
MPMRVRWTLKPSPLNDIAVQQLSIARLQLSPTTGFVVGDDLLQHGFESGRVDLGAPTNGNSAGGLVVVIAAYVCAASGATDSSAALRETKTTRPTMTGLL